MKNRIIGICGALLLLFACTPADPPAPVPPTTPLDPVRFTDATAIAGIDFQMRSGGQVKNYIVESKGGGGAFFDYDSDGWLDIYLVNGSRLGDQTEPAPANALYRNQGNGTFADHTLTAGVGDTAWGMGCAAADFDNDGDSDLYITNYGPNTLYRNQGDGTFHEISRTAGVDLDGWSTSATFGDYDLDGDLDLYVAQYLEFSPATAPPRGGMWKGALVFTGPLGLQGTQDVLYRNEGDGQFSDATQISGISQANRYYGLGVIPSDYDLDGDQDLFVANDETPNVLFQNQGDGTFRDVGLIAGVAYNGDGDAEAGMGVDFGDYDNDGDTDLYVTHFFTETNTLYRNEGGRFTDVTTSARLAAPTVDLLGWGTRFFDHDNDGLLDLFVANGHVYPQVDRIETGSTYPQSNQLFHNQGDGTFLPIDAGPDLAREKVSRGTAFGDYDDDGDIDLLVVELNDAPTLLRNDGGNANNWLAVKVIGADDNRDGAGTRIHLRTGDESQWREINGAASYLSHNDLRAHFGLNKQEKIDRIEITWPNGDTDAIDDLPANKLLVVRQGQGHTLHTLGPEH